MEKLTKKKTVSNQYHIVKLNQETYLCKVSNKRKETEQQNTAKINGTRFTFTISRANNIPAKYVSVLDIKAIA